MIEVRDVSKIYGKKQSSFAALKNVSFTIPDGKTAAIIGKSGSGKSTMMHLLGGLDHVTQGEITIEGKNLAKLKRKAMDRFRARDLGFVFQSFFVEGNATCYQNVVLPLEINRVSRGSRKKRVEAALEQVELLDKINVKAKNLSGGQKQRLAIARAIVGRPKLILADEPTGNLDSATGEKVIQLLFKLHRELGSTLIIVTHDADLARRCDMQISLKDGTVTSINSNAPVRSRSRSMTPRPGPAQQRRRQVI
jgi:putative ABC transport system ATP-binding protein